MNDSALSLRRTSRWSARLASVVARPRMVTAGFSFADQAFSVGGVFLANVILARTQSKEEYGVFALSYSVFILLSSLHNAAILEPYSVYGSGRYRNHFPEYLRLIARSNVLLGLLLTAILLLCYGVLLWTAPGLFPHTLLGLALAITVLLSATFVRRVFYVRRQPALAARASLLFFITVACGLGLTLAVRVLDSLSVYLVLAVGWLVAMAGVLGKLPFREGRQNFLESEPGYWREHWKYARWVLATAFVFQLGTQGYYWVVAGLLSVKDVAGLKVMYILVAPVEQVLIVFSYLALPALASCYARREMENFFSLWKLYALATLAATGSFAVLVKLVAKPVMHMLYAGKFDDLVPFIYILVLSPLLLGIGATMSNSLNAIEKPKLVFRAYLCSGAATFLVGIPLVRHFGLRGAVYGILCSGGTYTLALAVGFVANFRRYARRREAVTQ